MKYFRLIWSGIWRKPARTVFMMLSIIVAFMLLGILHGVDTSLKQSIALVRLDVLITANRAGLPLPLADMAQIAAVKGVTSVTYSAGFVGTYQTHNQVAVTAIDPDSYFSLSQGTMRVSAAGLAAFRRMRTGALVMRDLAQRLNWKIGDHVSIVAPTERRKDGSQTWSFDIVGYIDMPQNSSGPAVAPLLMMRYGYYDAARAVNPGTVRLYVERIADASQATAIATAIDKLFISSPVPTHTDTERANAQAQLAQIGDLALQRSRWRSSAP